LSLVAVVAVLVALHLMPQVAVVLAASEHPLEHLAAAQVLSQP
jgi:hypothetical protein